MYEYVWDESTGGLLLTTNQSKFSKEPRPVYYRELDILGFDRFWNYERDDSAPYMWAEANNYIYKGRLVAKTKGGSIYTKPEIEILDEPESNGAPLQFVDIKAMCDKNRDTLETLVQETIMNIYNTYMQYKDKVDLFHVSYSGGKDSVLLLDLVQRALPHNAFVVIFGDTQMEFPDTYTIIEKAKQYCKNNDIRFYSAKSDLVALDSWNIFGAPSTTKRWCCGVHKTVPQLLKLREITGKTDVREMAFVGVRRDESVRRSGYDYISYGTKHSGQSSCNPLLEWSSSEVYLYIFDNQLPFNNAYKNGSSRVGCLLCPMAAHRSDYFNYALYHDKIQPYIDTIGELYVKGHTNKKLAFTYLNNKGWKWRSNGRDLSIGINNFNEETKDGETVITFKPNNNSWVEWLKTVGECCVYNDEGTITCDNQCTIHFKAKPLSGNILQLKFKVSDTKKDPTLFKLIKNCLKKSHSCVACRFCEANCPYGNIRFEDGKVRISSNCIKCGLCNRADNGCLVFNSLIMPKGVSTMKNGSIDEYGTHAPKKELFDELVKFKEQFEANTIYNKPKITMFKRFLRDADVIKPSNSFGKIAQLLFDNGASNETVWALMLCNLAYSAQVGWFVNNVSFNVDYSQAEIKDQLSLFITTKTGAQNVSNVYKHLTELTMSRVGFGQLISTNKNSYVIKRTPWQNPVPEVILYSLFKFAEACDGYYQFSLSELMDDSIEREGISPTRIFGLNRETMIALLNNLSTHHPDFIRTSFTLNLETVTLSDDKTADDVLELF